METASQGTPPKRKGTAIRRALAAAIAEAPRSRQSDQVRALLAPYRDMIAEALKVGHSRSSLAKRLRAAGVEASEEMIRQCLGEIVTVRSGDRG